MTGRRHPCQVTADRIGVHLYDLAFVGRLDGAQRDVLSEARQILEDAAGPGAET